ncbi:MAG: hypothetical protein CMH52_06675 [Myxococcales bacterium]|nr:hypothetical protein [Myxococcales bacterium]|tara:strand:+ start:1134 stop:1916 length:783 start_codon:yes stop_codon:yes gene_type:complete
MTKLTPFAIILLLLTPGFAAPPTKDLPSEDIRAFQDWDLGTALIGFAVGSFIDEPSESKKVAQLGLIQARVPYAGFAGIGGGSGLTVDALWKGIIGLQLGLWYSNESASGNLDIRGLAGGSGTRYELTFNKSAWHLPVVVKLSAPTKTVRPFLLIGGDFIFPSSSDIETEFGNARMDDRSYSALHFGLGLDFRLNLNDVDIRIPFSLRGNYNLELGESVGDRIEFSGCSNTGGNVQCSAQTYRTDWQYQAFVSIGLAIHY